MPEKYKKRGRSGWIAAIAYIAAALVVVYTVFLITSYLQLERGLVKQEGIVFELRDAFINGEEAREFSAIEQELDNVQAVNREIRLRNALITVGASSVLGIILIVILILFAQRTKELYRERAQTESTLLSIGDGIMVTDEFGQIMLVNPAFEKMLGWEQKDVLGREAAEFFPALDEKGKKVAAKERLIPKTLKDRSALTSVMYYKRRSGTVFPAAVTVTPIMQGGRVAGAIEVLRDITRQKEIDQAKDTFISIASHQLRTPLTSVRWLLEILATEKAGKISPEQLDIVQEAHSSVLRLNALVAELLNVSRIETGRLEVKPELVDIVKLADDVARELQVELKDKNVAIKKDFVKGLPKIKVDPLIVRQIMLNILSNAIKYSYKGGEVIFNIEKEGKFVRFEIKDSGIGIPEEDREKIFGRFFRASNVGGAREMGGTGLGLFLAKGLAELSGGQIGFDSEEGKGTTFWFTLPLAGSRKREGEVSLSTSKGK